MRDKIPAHIRERIDARMQQQQSPNSQPQDTSGFQQPSNQAYNQTYNQQQTNIPPQYAKTVLSKEIRTFFLIADILLLIVFLACLYGIFFLP